MKKDVLDTADKIILDILQENAKTPLKDIARKVYLSTPAVSARIEKMEKEGIITAIMPRSILWLWDIISKP